MRDVSPLREGDPDRLGRYRLVGRLGEGGQGVVFLGRDPEDVPVAIKVVRSEFAANAAARSRFAKEVTAAQRVEAQFCVAQVLDADLAATPPYVVTEFVDGPTLGQSIRDDGPRTGAALHRLAVATATALAAIHQAGVAHRDFKPANVLLGADGPRVIDFGIARVVDTAVTQTGTIVGTPSYMAPEQFSGKAGAPADVFGWGCVMVYAASGHPPFRGADMPTLVNQILNHEPDLGQLTGPLRDIVHAGLRKDPATRPTMQQIVMRLLGEPSDFPPAPPPLPAGFPATPLPAVEATTVEAPAGRPRRGRVMGVVAAAAVIAVAIAAGALARPLLNDSNAGPTNSPSTSSPASGAPVGGITRTPRLGLEFWQGSAAVPMSFNADPTGSNAIVTVQMKAAPFQLRFPKQSVTSLKICAWTDRSIFIPREGMPTRSDQCLGEGRGMADYEFGSGTLMLNNEGFNYLVDTRIQSLSADTSKVDFSQVFQAQEDKPLQQQRGDLYLAIYAPKANDGKFHIVRPAELEYVILRFPS
ncbi:serine/threonine-protein kinase [Actinomadura rudentiformis]|uniref:Serine/threonine protein kinase n=1 Tax=Actinomadura rudentiformis TaxID=359158 RepID=A0A6H9YJJ1_9ACTN|nr:serine/threonine-protein kinase [Actinomadura rudentiformis]KAB2344447.1 serine/threonine protein kinase [Actinomadura rudentiformis]